MCGSDKQYLRSLAKAVRDVLGFATYVYTTDPPWLIRKGSLPGTVIYTCALDPASSSLTFPLLLPNFMDDGAMADPPHAGRIGGTYALQLTPDLQLYASGDMYPPIVPTILVIAFNLAGAPTQGCRLWR